MKYLNTILIVTLFLFINMLSGCVTVPEGSARIQQQSEQMVPPDGKAGVYVFRPALLGSGAFLQWQAELDSKLFGYLAPRSYLYGFVSPGKHSVGGGAEGSLPATTFNAKEGANYYFKLSFFSGLVPIKTDEARQLMHEYTLSRYNVFENIRTSNTGNTSNRSTDSELDTTPQERISTYKFDDYAKAYALYRPLAEQGDVEAQLILSRMYSEGIGVEKDDLKSIEWHAIAVEKGNASIRRGFDLQLANIRKNAQKGDANAQYKLGILYRNGWGVPANFSEAIKWHRKAAEQGHTDSKDMLRNTFFARERICTNSKYKFEVEAAKGWDVNSIAPGDKSFWGYCEFKKKGTHLAPIITVTIDLLHDYMLNYSLSDVTEYIMKSTRATEIIEKPHIVTINSLPASKTVYEMPGIKVILYQFRKENVIVTIQLIDQLATFESNVKDFKEIVRSFTFHK